MSDITRREILSLIKRLGSLGLLEVVRPILIRDPQFAELLAQQQGVPKQQVPTPPASPTALQQGIDSFMAFLQAEASQLSQLHQQLAGEVLGVSAGFSGATLGFQFSANTTAAVSVDLDAGTVQGGLFASAGLEWKSSQIFSAGATVTPFVGLGSASGLSGSTNSVQVGPASLSANSQVATVGWAIGPSVGLPSGPAGQVTATSAPANMAWQLFQFSSNLPDTAAPFQAFYSWLNGLSQQAWAPYASPDLPFPPDE